MLVTYNRGSGYKYPVRVRIIGSVTVGSTDLSVVGVKAISADGDNGNALAFAAILETTEPTNTLTIYYRYWTNSN